MPSLYPVHWQQWLDFRRLADSFTWKFNELKQTLSDLSVRQKIYAYGRIHILKKITRNDLTKDAEEITLETFSE